MPGNPGVDMVDAAVGVSFSVVFFDGEKEINIGNVAVFPSMTYKNLQSVMSKKIGFSPNQFSIYLCKKLSSTSDSGNRVPITAKVNFSVIMNEKYGYFLVVLRRKTMRRQKGNKEWLGDGYGSNMGIAATTQPNEKNPPFNRVLLRRSIPDVENRPFSGCVSPTVNQLDRWNRNLQIERERCLMNMGVANLYLGRPEKETREFWLHCVHCLKTKVIGRRDDEFHCCVGDPVIIGFRSAAGPVGRPTKKSI